MPKIGLNQVVFHADTSHHDAGAERRITHDLVQHAGDSDAFEDHRRPQIGGLMYTSMAGRTAGSATTCATHARGERAPRRREVGGDDRFGPLQLEGGDDRQA